MLLTLDSGVGRNSHKALLTVPDTLYMAINISCGHDGDKGDNDCYAGPCMNIGEAERNMTDVDLGLMVPAAWCEGRM